MICVTYTDFGSRLASVKRLREAFPGVPILSRGGDLKEVVKLQEAGANIVIPELSEVSMSLGSAVLDEFGVLQDVKTEARKMLRNQLEARAIVALQAECKVEQGEKPSETVS